MNTLAKDNSVWKSRILIFLLLVFSGNPLTSFFGKFSILVFFITALMVARRRLFEGLKNTNLIIFLSVFLAVFILQYYTLGYVSWLGAANMILKVICGASIVIYVGKRFSSMLFFIVSKLCLISLFGYFLINILNINLPSIAIGKFQHSYIFYGITAFHPYKNEGMFWEPGAFAGIIVLTLLLNFTYLKSIWINKKFNLCIILGALLTTQSTTGYLLTTFILFTFFIINSKNVITRIFSSGVFLIIFIFGMLNLDFLGQKISFQLEVAQKQRSDEFANTRFGSMIFDWNYIRKHPIVGNGLDEKTRYSDNPEILEIIKYKDGDLGNGNGFSNFLASMGIPLTVIYFVLIYRNYMNKGILHSLFVCALILLLLQGEQWLINGPIFLACPFIIDYSKKARK